MTTLEATLTAAGQALADAADKTARYLQIVTGVGQVVPDHGVSGIKPRMRVRASCGRIIGVVDALEGTTIRLARKRSADGRHHFIPVGWIEQVDDEVRLTRSEPEILASWSASAASGVL